MKFTSISNLTVLLCELCGFRVKIKLNMNRSEILERVKAREEPWDIVVIGGGATGVGCAVDAASRGFDVLLLEQSDFGKGTSSRSTKLVHGGVRYLAQGNISLVREALKERWILRKNAPHLVKNTSFIVPCYSVWQKVFYGVGLKFYNLVSGKYSFGKSRILSRNETLKELPNVKAEGLRGGVLYFDGQFDDTRLLINLVTTAHEKGAAMLNYAKVYVLNKDGSGSICGLEFEDAETGEIFSVNAKAVINATGAFCDKIREMVDESVEKVVTHSQGIHLVFDRKFLPGDNALMIPKTSDGRVLFAIPWLGHTLIGTTDTPIDHAELEPEAQNSEIDFILATIREYLAASPTRKDVLSIFVGIRPLVKSGDSKNTAALSRGHTIIVDNSNLLTITGGKWTTYRRMAEDAVIQAVKIAKLTGKSSATADLKIHGYSKNIGDFSIYGSDAEHIKKLLLDRPEFAEKLHPALPYCKAEVVWAVRNEMVCTLEDVLARRTRALFLNAQAAIDIAPTVARIMANELGKDDCWITEQVKKFNDVAKNYNLV